MHNVQSLLCWNGIQKNKPLFNDSLIQTLASSQEDQQTGMIMAGVSALL